MSLDESCASADVGFVESIEHRPHTVVEEVALVDEPDLLHDAA